MPRTVVRHRTRTDREGRAPEPARETTTGMPWSAPADAVRRRWLSRERPVGADLRVRPERVAPRDGIDPQAIRRNSAGNSVTDAIS